MNIGEFRETIEVYEAQESNEDILLQKTFSIPAKVKLTGTRGIWSSYANMGEKVEITLRKDEITQNNLLKWNGTDLWIYGIDEKTYGFYTISACRADIAVYKREDESKIIGAITEKYERYSEPRDEYGSIEQLMLLVTPKLVKLRSGDLIKSSAGEWYTVQVAHDLDPYKNEYEIWRRADV